jgi:tetratricopeptide (TPR) repeat protein
LRIIADRPSRRIGGAERLETALVPPVEWRHGYRPPHSPAVPPDGPHGRCGSWLRRAAGPEPDDADALHLFGVLHFQTGYFAQAIELIDRAITARPEIAVFHANLAEAHRALGHYEQAVACCETALKLQPAYPEAANNLGLALHALGRYAPAVEQFRAAVRLRPAFALAQNNLGTSLRELGRNEEALAAFRDAIAIDPALALARSNLGQSLLDAGLAGFAF